MNSIELNGVIPAVMAATHAEGHSQVWMQRVTFTRGNRYMVEAASGVGKSSLCAFIHGNRTDYLGTIAFDGISIASFDINRWIRLRRTAIAWLPQNLNLFPELSALDNIMVKNDLTGHKSRHEVMDMLDELGIADKASQPASQLSLGQQQRVALIRALCQPYDFLLLDEPVSHLDIAANRAMAALVNRDAAARGAAVIATSVGNPLMLQNAQSLSL